MLTVDDIKAYEAAYGQIPDGAIVVGAPMGKILSDCGAVPWEAQARRRRRAALRPIEPFCVDYFPIRSARRRFAPSGICTVGGFVRLEVVDGQHRVGSVAARAEKSMTAAGPIQLLMEPGRRVIPSALNDAARRCEYRHARRGVLADE